MLQELRMRSTNVTGRLPDTFARLTELRALDLANNSMTGWSICQGNCQGSRLLCYG
jgi:hypothetical protein